MEQFKSFPKPKRIKPGEYAMVTRLTPEQVAERLNKWAVRAKNKRLKAKKATLKKKRTRLPSIKKLLKKADTFFSLWVRRRDENKCFAVDIPGEGVKCKGAIQNCHLIKRSFKPTRFDETNCNAGCMHHNYNHDHGFNARPEIYTNWYLKKYGGMTYDDLITKSREFHKWTRDELLEIIKRYDIKKESR